MTILFQSVPDLYFTPPNGFPFISDSDNLLFDTFTVGMTSSVTSITFDVSNQSIFFPNWQSEPLTLAIYNIGLGGGPGTELFSATFIPADYDINYNLSFATALVTYDTNLALDVGTYLITYYSQGGLGVMGFVNGGSNQAFVDHLSTGIINPIGESLGFSLSGDVITTPPPVMLNAVRNDVTDLTTLTGTAEANASVSIFEDNNLIGTVISGSDGTWSLKANVTGGAVHSFTETSVDSLGQTASSSGVTYYTPAANKSLIAGTGDDVLIGRPGDKLTGGGGADNFVFNPHFGKEIVTDFDVTRDVLTFDHLLFANATASQVLSQTHDSTAGAVIVVDAADTITLTGVHLVDLQSHLNDFHFV